MLIFSRLWLCGVDKMRNNLWKRFDVRMYKEVEKYEQIKSNCLGDLCKGTGHGG